MFARWLLLHWITALANAFFIHLINKKTTFTSQALIWVTIKQPSCHDIGTLNLRGNPLFNAEFHKIDWEFCKNVAKFLRKSIILFSRNSK